MSQTIGKTDMTRRGKRKAHVGSVAAPEPEADAGDGYDAANNSARSYAEAIGAIRMEGVKAGRFLPNPGAGCQRRG